MCERIHAVLAELTFLVANSDAISEASNELNAKFKYLKSDISGGPVASR